MNSSLGNGSVIPSGGDEAENHSSNAAMARRFRLRLIGFLAPFMVIGFLIYGFGIASGELLPVRFIAWLQTFGKPFVFLTEFSDHTFSLKLDAARRFKPEVLVLGSSRANQWRSAMFRPATFYNAGNSIFAIGDFSRALDELGDYHPRVIIFSVDYFVFVPYFDGVYKGQSREELGGLGSPEQIRIIKGILKKAFHDPMAFWPRDNHLVPTIGLSAIKFDRGVRVDGSYQYGQVVHGPPSFDAEAFAAEIRKGKQWPVPPASHLDDGLLREFERFTDLARRKGIALVGVTMPFVPPVLNAIEQSPLYGGWRQFESQQTKEWIRSQGVIYFDFTRLGDFDGKADEFVDPFHPSETAYLRMLLAMLREPSFRGLVPNMDPVSLGERLKQGTPFEVYRNEF
jgi:hypothetical protein